MIRESIFQGLGLLYTIVVACMLGALVAMFIDFVSGWRKAKLRGEARTSYGVSRSITKFLMYEGALAITCVIDTLVHFAVLQVSDTVYYVPLVTILGAVVECVVEIMSIREKADEKERNRIDRALTTIVNLIGKDRALEVVKELLEQKEVKDEDHS